MIPIQKHERYAPLHDEINQLAGALGKVQARLASVDASLQAATVSTPPAEEGAAQVKAALEFAATGTVQLPRQEISTLSEERAALRDQEGALQKTLKARRQALDRVASELSAGVRGDMSAKHRELARRYVDKLEELAAILKEEDQMLAEAGRAGYDFSFPELLRNAAVGSIHEVGTSALYYHYIALRRYAGQA